MKIATLSLALVAVLFVMNSKAASDAGILTMNIHGEPGYCNYGTSLYLGDYSFSYLAQSITGDFNGVDPEGVSSVQWSCTDSLGVASRALTVDASTLLNMTTKVSAHTIPEANVRLFSDGVTVISGACTTFTGLDGWKNFGVDPINLISKWSELGDACRIKTDLVKIDVAYPASQAIGAYSGTITVNLPTLATL